MDGAVREDLVEAIGRLEAAGPRLRRPHADTLTGEPDMKRSDFLTVDQLIATLPVEEQAALQAARARGVAEVEGLHALRKLVGRTQAAIGRKLNVKQPSVHQIERQTDLYLSTLRRYVEAAGGELELRVSLPDHGTVVLTGVGEIAERADEPASKAAA